MNVRDFSKVARDRVKEKVEQLRVAAASSTLSNLSLDMTEVDSYNQVLCIELENASKENVLAAIEELQKRDDVIYAGPDYVVSITSTVPNDTKFVDQTASTRIQLPEAWDITTGSSSVVVGVIDSGIDATHSDLKNRVNVELSCDFTGATPVEGVTTDPLNHGTHVAGIIGAEGNNSKGVAGVCWNVTLVSLRVLDENGYGYTSDVANAIRYADSKGIKILNMSARWYSYYSTYDYVLYSVIENYSGLFVCAAGNENKNNDNEEIYPARYTLPNLITVGASNSYDKKWPDSNYGRTTVDIFAPGTQIMSTKSGGGYEIQRGTSMASPYVAGVAALLLAQYPNMTPAQLKNTILAHAEIIYDEDGDSVFGDLCVSGGRLNAYNVFCHTYTCTASSSIYEHTYTCWTCGYAYYETHTWVDKGTYYRCSVCGKESLVTPGGGSVILEYPDSDLHSYGVDVPSVVFLDNSTFMDMRKQCFGEKPIQKRRPC